MSEILTNTYYGNSLKSWLIALTIIVLSMLLGKIIYWFFTKFARIFTAKSKAQLDDIIVDMIEEPITFMVIIMGVWFALETLILPDGLTSFIANTYQVIIALLVGWLVSRLFDALYQQYIIPFTEKSASELDDQLAPVLSKGVKLIIWTMAIIIGLNNAGYDVAALLAGLGIGGFAIAMAAKDTVSNVFGGFTIFTDKPFKIRDRIQIAGYDGTVVEIGVRSTRLKTLDGRIVTIPNAKFADAPVENVSLEPTRKVKINLGLTYDTSPEKMQQALDILNQIHKDNQNTDDECIVGFNAFGDFSLNILFIYYIKKGEDIIKTQTAINMAILQQFNQAGLDFAFPTQTLYNINQST